MSSRFPDVITIPMARLRKLAAKRPAGYIEDVTSCGVISNGFLVLTRAEHQRLRHKYNPIIHIPEKFCPDCAQRPVQFIPEDPNSERKKKEDDRKAFRKLFLGSLETVPPNVLHLRLAMEDERVKLTSEGCTGCKLGTVIGEFAERAWRHHLRSIRAQG